MKTSGQKQIIRLTFLVPLSLGREKNHEGR